MNIMKDPKNFSFNFDWPKDVDENLNYEIEFIIKRNQSLAENKIKNETEQLFLKNISMETISMNTERSKTNESHKFVLNLLQRMDLKISNRHVLLIS